MELGTYTLCLYSVVKIILVGYVSQYVTLVLSTYYIHNKTQNKVPRDFSFFSIFMKRLLFESK